MNFNDDGDIHTNTKCYISIDALPGDAFHVGWVEPTGDLVIRYDPDSVRRLLRMFRIPRDILLSHNDPELPEIKEDLDFCIDFLEHVIGTCYSEHEVVTNA